MELGVKKSNHKRTTLTPILEQQHKGTVEKERKSGHKCQF